MSDEESGLSRRRIVQSAALAMGSVSVPTAAAAPPQSEDLFSKPINNIALEANIHPDTDIVAFTAITDDDGFQLYVAPGISDLEEDLDERRVTQLTNADAGVHGLQWVGRRTLKYSVDGRTVVQRVKPEQPNISVTSNQRTIDDEPLPFRQGCNDSVCAESVSVPDIPYPIDIKNGNVACTDIPHVTNWCIRADVDDPSHSPECYRYDPPNMTHAHLGFFREGDYRSGVNLWAGYDGRCVWVGEEHYTQPEPYCNRACAPNGGIPGISVLRDLFEDALETAVNHAGLAVSSTVITAMAYFLAVKTPTPPVPGSPVF